MSQYLLFIKLDMSKWAVVASHTVSSFIQIADLSTRFLFNEIKRYMYTFIITYCPCQQRGATVPQFD